MESIATISRSVFSSRRGSRHLDDITTNTQNTSRRESLRTSAEPSTAEDKIALAQPSALEQTQDQESDSMKFAVTDSLSPSKKFTTNSFGADFGKAILDDEQFKSLGLDGTLLSAPTLKGMDDPVSEKIPAIIANPVQWQSNVYELDVPAGVSRESSQPGLIPQNEDGDGTPPGHANRAESSGEGERRGGTGTGGGGGGSSLEVVRTPDQNTGSRHARQNTVPLLNDSPGKEVVKPRRPLSGLSIKSLTAPFSRGSDAPEVVPQRSPRPREHDRNRSIEARPVTMNHTRMQSNDRPDFDRHASPAALTNQYQQPNHLTNHHLRAMQSSPALNRAAAVPASPAVPRPWMSRRPSAGSLRSTISNVNKPLPPEPPGLDVANSSRSNSTPNARPTPQSQPQPASSSSARRPSDVQNSQPSSPSQATFGKDVRSKSTSSGRTPLKSRFARDLDAIDDAFQRSVKTPYVPATAADMAYRDPLDTIRESPRGSQHYEKAPVVQVPRGTGRMEPSRRPPPTPKSRGLSPVRDTRPAVSIPSTPRRPSIPQPRVETVSAQANASSSSASSKPKDARSADGRSNPESPTVHRGGGRPKLQQILGEDNVGADDGQQERSHPPSQPLPAPPSLPSVSRPQANLNRDAFEQSAPPSAVSEAMSRAGSIPGAVTTPFRTGTSDAQFDEIRRRIDLLSPLSAGDGSFVSSQILGQFLSNQMTTTPMSAQTGVGSDYNVGDIDPTEVQPLPLQPQPLPAAEPRNDFQSPVELPADLGWQEPAPQAFEMDASEKHTLPAGFTIPVPPPIPDSPTRRGVGLQRHSTVSSGSGRTKSLRSVKSARSARSAKARSLTSLAISEIQELYAGIPSPRTTLASRRPSITAEETIPELPPMPEVMTTEELEEQDVISANVAEQVLYQILRNLHEPTDLFNASLVSRGFQRTFRRHDTKLLRHALWYTSGPAWEFLEMHMPISNESGQLEYPPNIYRVQYVHDMRVMSHLKSLILRHCGSILSRDTTGLLCANNKSESAPIDDAIWRIWTFCKIFGEDVDRREDLEMQKRWIKGQTMMEAKAQGGHTGKYSIQEYPAFAFGNDEGLTPQELILMGEIWLCLRQLVRGYQGRRNEAREYGIFDGVEVARNDIVREEAILDEWTIHLLSLSPGTNIEILAPERATASNFIKAEQLGYTNWTPPGRNFISSGFLTGPICGVLQEWLDSETEANANVHPALRPSGASAVTGKTTGAPSRRTVEGFVSHIRTSQDGSKIRKVLNGSETTRPQLTVDISQSHAQRLLSESNTPGMKSVKEGKKSGGFGSKFGFRMPSRSQNVAKSRSKALATAPAVPKLTTASSSPNGDKQTAPSSPVNSGNSNNNNNSNPGSRFELIRRNLTRTRKNSAARENGAGNVYGHANGRLSPGDAVTTALGSQANLSSSNTTTELGSENDAPSNAMPIRMATERLLEHGFDPESIDRIVQELGSNGVVNFDRAVKKLKKAKMLRERLMRLDRMG